MFVDDVGSSVRRLFALASQRGRMGEIKEPDDARPEPIVRRDVKPSNDRRRIVRLP